MNKPQPNISYTELTDKELVDLFLQGDHTAFSTIFQRYYRHLWTVALRSTASAHDAEDCLQEAMLKAYKVLDTFRWQSSLSSWLHRIVVNTCIDRIRNNQRNAIPISDYEPFSSSLSRTDDTATKMTIQHAINQLSNEHKEIILLLDVEGYSLKETAEMLHLPIGTVKSRSGRARARLAQLLGYETP